MLEVSRFPELVEPFESRQLERPVPKTPSRHEKLLGTTCPTEYVPPSAGEAIVAVGPAGVEIGASAKYRSPVPAVVPPPTVTQSYPPRHVTPRRAPLEAAGIVGAPTVYHDVPLYSKTSGVVGLLLHARPVAMHDVVVRQSTSYSSWLSPGVGAVELMDQADPFHISISGSHVADGEGAHCPTATHIVTLAHDTEYGSFWVKLGMETTDHDDPSNVSPRSWAPFTPMATHHDALTHDTEVKKSPDEPGLTVGSMDHAVPSHCSARVCAGPGLMPCWPTAMQSVALGQAIE